MSLGTGVVRSSAISGVRMVQLKTNVSISGLAAQAGSATQALDPRSPALTANDAAEAARQPAGTLCLPTMTSEISDEDLMCRYRAGEERAFEQLYTRHKGGLYRYFLRQCSNRSTAEELYQDVWMRVITSRPRSKQSLPPGYTALPTTAWSIYTGVTRDTRISLSKRPICRRISQPTTR